MPSTRRDFLKEAAASLLAASSPVGFAANETPSLQSQLKKTADELGLPGFVAGVVRNGKLDAVQAEGFADLEQQTPMRRDHIFYIASLTKTFSAVMMMQYVQEKKLSLDDYILDYPFLTVGLTPDRLIDPNVRLKHAMSHTSEGVPGDSCLYNGNRYNFIYGVFEKMSGNTHHYDAVAQEFKKRIAGPLSLTSTLSGYPTDQADPRIPRIVKAYFLDSGHPKPTLDTSAPKNTTQYASSGLLSSVDDLAKYMVALDENALITHESYSTMTAPFVLNDGRKSPYGLGWSTQIVGGQPVHSAYGYDDSYAALLVRIPNKKTSFILLSNCGAASAPFYLGWGNLLKSPFAVSFLRQELPGVLHETDAIYAEAFLQHYRETVAGSAPDTSLQLLHRLKTESPEHFEKSDRGLIYLMGGLSAPSLDQEMETLAKTYDASGDFHPDIDLAIANFYKRVGSQDKYLARLHRIADRPGYGEQGSTREACIQLGTALLERGQATGRKYLWMAAQYGQVVSYSTASLDAIVTKMHAANRP